MISATNQNQVHAIRTSLSRETRRQSYHDEPANMDGRNKENDFCCTFQSLLTILIHDCAFIHQDQAIIAYLQIDVDDSSSQMSFSHRRLPLLSNEVLEHRWSAKPDALLSYKIMPDETYKAASKDNKPPTPTPNTSSPADDRATPSPGDVDLEDYESPKYPPPRSAVQEPEPADQSTKTARPSVSRRDSDTWQGESPSSICLCQPDPKVPRPRNGMYPIHRTEIRITSQMSK